jgi:hypothetical protein
MTCAVIPTQRGRRINGVRCLKNLPEVVRRTPPHAFKCDDRRFQRSEAKIGVRKQGLRQSNSFRRIVTQTAAHVVEAKSRSKAAVFAVGKGPELGGSRFCHLVDKIWNCQRPEEIHREGGKIHPFLHEHKDKIWRPCPTLHAPGLPRPSADPVQRGAEAAFIASRHSLGRRQDGKFKRAVPSGKMEGPGSLQEIS